MFLFFHSIAFIFCVHTASSRVYLLDNRHWSNERNADNDLNFHLQMFSPTTDSPRENILEPQSVQLTAKPRTNKCDRSFGSIFGTEIQKVLCLEKIKDDRRGVERDREFINERDDNKRGVPKKKHAIINISEDYIDIDELYRQDSDGSLDGYSFDGDLNERTTKVLPADHLEYLVIEKLLCAVCNAGGLTESFKCKVGDRETRKSNRSRPKHTRERKGKNHRNKKSRKPKRFEIVGGSGDSRNSQKVRKPPSFMKKKSKDVYLQGGNRVVDVVADDEDGRRRLPQFLPKRYHWKPHEIHELGYYWFNGPKGQYPDPMPLKK